jgi:DNA (cytosine-5)-methyltransferase 1
MMKPRLLDLYCGAGGASAGYDRVGFEVTGVDINPQKNYPFHFNQGDALEFLYEYGHYFDAIHASPPCQRHSAMSNCRPGLAEKYPDLIDATRQALLEFNKPWVIENVPGSPLNNPITLCGQMFGLELYRHRLFESNIDLDEPVHPDHVMPASKAGHWKPGTVMSISGHIAPIAKAREVMGIDWCNREELAEAIPPAYTEYVGKQFMGWISIRDLLTAKAYG